MPRVLLTGASCQTALCARQVAKPDSEALDDPSIISFGWSANDDAVLLLELEDLLQVEVQESDVHAVLGGSTGRMPREELVRMLRARLLPPSPAVSTSLHLCTPLAAIAEEDSTACCSVSISCSVNSSMAAWSVVERRATGGAFSPISASAGSITSLTSPSAVRSPTSPSTLTWLQNQLRRSGSFDASQLARPEPRSQGPQAGAWAAPDAPVSSSTSDTLQAGSDQFASHSRRLAPIATTRPPSYQQDKPQLPGYLPAQQQSDTWTSDSTGSRLRQGRKLRPGLQQQQHRAVGGNLRSHPLPGNLWWYTEHEDLLPEDSATAQKLLVPQLFSGRHQALMERLSWLGNGAYSSVYMGYIERQPVVIKVRHSKRTLRSPLCAAARAGSSACCSKICTCLPACLH